MLQASRQFHSTYVNSVTHLSENYP